MIWPDPDRRHAAEYHPASTVVLVNGAENGKLSVLVNDPSPPIVVPLLFQWFTSENKFKVEEGNI